MTARRPSPSSPSPGDPWSTVVVILGTALVIAILVAMMLDRSPVR